MLKSRNEQDTQLANHMIGTFDYEKNLLWTWKFCRELYIEAASYYLNRRMKSVRTFIDKYFNHYNHMEAASFFRYCEMKGLLTPEIFNHVYLTIQNNIRVLYNPDVYTVKFEMKPKYKELLKQHMLHGKDEVNN